MSGYFALAHLDERPLDRELLDRPLQVVRFLGPDGCRTWADRFAGLGFAKKATTEEAVREHQPLSLDGETWIVADARIDGREDLCRNLEARGHEGVPDATDAELILHAYAVWGEATPEHLLGDFSFAIWDSPRRRLFVARDHFGVKPLYYSDWPGGIMVGNNLQSLLSHPLVESTLDEAAIADFLMFGWNLEPGTTSFRSVKRLPPGHSALWEPGGRRLRRYWRLPDEPEPRLRDGDLVERFGALLRLAVRDRLRSKDASILMSGGLDSTAVAAVAAELSASGSATRLACFTQGYDRLISDEEPALARLVARSLGLPHDYKALDDYRLAERWGDLPLSPEPTEHVMDAMKFDFDREVAGHSRVALTGYGGDVVLMPETEYLGKQLRALRLDRVASYFLGSLWRGARPPLGLHTRYRRRRIEHDWRAGYPTWLDPDLERRLDLEDRWRWFQLDRKPEKLHPVRPRAQIELADLGWTNIFEMFDPGSAILSVEKRHPFFDLRLVECMLSAWPVPWCISKHLLRQSMRGRLPEIVRRRKKTPLPEVPRHAEAQPALDLWKEMARGSRLLARFAQSRRALESSGASPGTGLSTEGSRVLSLAYWLHRGRLR